MQRLHRNRPVEMQWFLDIYIKCFQQQLPSIFTDTSKNGALQKEGEDVYQNGEMEARSSEGLISSPTTEADGLGWRT